MTIETSMADKVGRREVRRPSNVTLLYVARAARGFGDGFAVIILAAYLPELGFSTLQVYDITFLLSFRHLKPPEEHDARDEAVRTSAQECADGVDR
jgi:hypothetical protein